MQDPADHQQQQTDDSDGVPVYVPLKVRRAREAALLSSHLSAKAARRAMVPEPVVSEPVAPERPTKSLVELSQSIVKTEGIDTEERRRKEQEDFLTENLISDRGPLLSAAERAAGLKSMERMQSSWSPPRHIAKMSLEQSTSTRQRYRILIEGDDIPPPITSFRQMKLPSVIIDYLSSIGVRRPTPIQMQALPVALSRRDLIGIASTGSGKTLTFVLPMVMAAVEAEMRLPLISGEGPVGLVVCPSRELAEQTFEIVKELSAITSRYFRMRLNSLLCIGGIDMREQMDPTRNPIHVIVATPGRLLDMLSRGKLSLTTCSFLTLDEADRMIDLGFDDDVRALFGYFQCRRQTVMFSATMPTKIKQFATTSLIDPVVVNVGRAGAASMDVIQHVEYVKEENRIVYLLQCLQKTAPPVLIFCSNVSDVDDIGVYLLIKGVEAVCIHGGKSQDERQAAVKAFKSGQKDVLVATDIASKGLDFPDVQHVINFDMPKEIEDYVHRIGRTGRRGNTGLATTFINRSCNETILLDLKHLLVEAGQRVPPFLQGLQESAFAHGGCAYCGGLGHGVTDCPKYMAHSKEKMKAFMGSDVEHFSGGY